jgi:hypothetical protein
MKKGLNISKASAEDVNKMDRQHNRQKKKGKTTIYKTLHRKQTIEQQEPLKNRE